MPDVGPRRPNNDLSAAARGSGGTPSEIVVDVRHARGTIQPAMSEPADPERPLRVFISHRWADGVENAHNIKRRIELELPGTEVFLDDSKIQSGETFEAKIFPKLVESTVVLALIGDRWLRRRWIRRARIHEESDWVHRELTIAADRGITVVPVLRGRTKPPAKSDLPKPLWFVTGTKQHVIRGDADWDRDVTALIKLLPDRHHDTLGFRNPGTHVDLLLDRTTAWDAVKSIGAPDRHAAVVVGAKNQDLDYFNQRLHDRVQALNIKLLTVDRWESGTLARSSAAWRKRLEAALQTNDVDRALAVAAAAQPVLLHFVEHSKPLPRQAIDAGLAAFITDHLNPAILKHRASSGHAVYAAFVIEHDLEPTAPLLQTQLRTLTNALRPGFGDCEAVAVGFPEREDLARYLEESAADLDAAARKRIMRAVTEVYDYAGRFRDISRGLHRLIVAERGKLRRG